MTSRNPIFEHKKGRTEYEIPPCLKLSETKNYLESFPFIILSASSQSSIE